MGEKLRERLRAEARRPAKLNGQPAFYLSDSRPEAADALDAQAARIKALEEEVAMLRRRCPPVDVKSTRHALGLTVEGLARALDVSGETIRQWERRARPVPGSVALVCDLAAAIPAVADRLRELRAAKPRGRPRSVY